MILKNLKEVGNEVLQITGIIKTSTSRKLIVPIIIRCSVYQIG